MRTYPIQYIYAPGFSYEAYELWFLVTRHYTEYIPTSISSDKKTAVLEYYDNPNVQPFPADQQGPFYAINMFGGIWPALDSYINTDGSFHIESANPGNHFNNSSNMPMIARADNYGQLPFKHIFGMLKTFVTVPDGYTVTGVTLIGMLGVYTPATIDACDVSWDENGDITISNITKVALQANQREDLRNYSFKEGNGYYYLAACPGDWTDLRFKVDAVNSNQRHVAFIKIMNPNSSIHIERAGITTLNLNMTPDDLLR